MYKTLPITRVLLLALAGCWAGPAGAADDAGTGSPPVAGRLRELSTDRPDVTESPYTIDAGHSQVELDFANLTQDRAEGERSTAWEAAPCNLRLGVTDDLEVGLFLTPYRRVEEKNAAGATRTRSGTGDLVLRGKWNFTGNNGGTAVGLIGDIKLPTATAGLGNGAVEGTVLLPVSWELGDGWGLAAMTGVDLRLRQSGHGREGAWINSFSFERELTPHLAGYLELAAESAAGAPTVTLDAGLMYKLDANTQLDGGVQRGLSRAADDLHVFAGLSHRL